MFRSYVWDSVPVLLALILVSAALCASLVGLVLEHRTARRARADAETTRAELDRMRAAVAAPERRGVRAMKAVVGTAVESATRLRENGVAGLLMSSIEDLTNWAVEDRSEIARMVGPNGTVSILFSDIEDSTALNARLGDEDWVRLLAAHDEVVHAIVERHHGHIVKSQGDGFMIVFGQAADAVRAGMGIQDALSTSSHRSRNKELRRNPIRVRVGIHCGTVVERDGDFFGRNVAKAARVAALAKGGQVLVSDEVRRDLREVDDIVLVGFQESELKGLPGRHRLWEVSTL